MTQRGRGDGTPTFDERIEDLQRVVDLLVGKMGDEFGLRLDYSPRSVAYMDAVLTELRRNRRALTPGLFLSIGGYVGETLVRAYDGEWAELDGTLAVTLEGDAHRTTLRVFDWVKDAYADPEERNLGARLRETVGDGLDHQGWGSGDTATA